MDRKFNRNLQLGYGFSIIMLLLVGGISYLTVVSMLRSNDAVRHSNRIIQKLENAISLMKDAETGQRGYLLTGKTIFLAPYNGAPKAALKLIDEAAVLTRDNARQQANIAGMRSVLLQRLTILQAMIDKRQHGQSITAADLDNGKIAMDALRNATDKARIEEQRLLKQRTEMLSQYTAIAPPIIVVAILLAAGIALSSYFKVMQDIGIKEKLRNELQQREQETAALNEELMAANEEITAANEELTAINEELLESREELESLNESLEMKVATRTKALADSEEETATLNEELTATNEELAATNEELQATNEELAESQFKLQQTVDQLTVTKNQVEKSERLFVTIAKNIPGSLILVMNHEQKLLAAEGDLMDRLGFRERQLVGKYLYEVAPNDRYAATKPFYDRMLAGEQFRMERKGADGADYQVDFVPLYTEQNEVYAGMVIAQDITDLKRAEERSAKLAAIVESSDDAIIGKTLEGIITSWNRGAEQMFGYDETEMVGASIFKLIPEDRQDEEPVILGRLSRGEKVEHYETKRKTSDGRLIDVSLTMSPIRDTAGLVTGVSKIARDISEQKRDEQRKNDFIGMASHELKTPLTSLSALIQVLNLKLRSNEDPFVPSALEKSLNQVKKMTGMINGFLNISRLESGKLQIDKHPMELNTLIGEMIDEARLTITSHTIVFEPTDRLIVNADKDKVGSVISNLLSNAVKYSPRGKIIIVTAGLVDDAIQVSVTDEGMGIKPQDISRLFDRYYRVSSEHTRNISGFGIGLYLSAEIIERHGGRIWVESEKGLGSTFYFTLPVA